MRKRGTELTSSVEARATCPECGAAVALVRSRWLDLHSVGSTEYTYQHGSHHRCPGSLMLVAVSGRG